jgi:hypothetical protein
MPEFAPVTSAFWPLRTFAMGMAGITAAGSFSSRRCCCINSFCSDGMVRLKARLGGSLISGIEFIFRNRFRYFNFFVLVGRRERGFLTKLVAANSLSGFGNELVRLGDMSV